jgi:hypothetical protein
MYGIILPIPRGLQKFSLKAGSNDRIKTQNSLLEKRQKSLKFLPPKVGANLIYFELNLMKYRVSALLSLMLTRRISPRIIIVCLDPPQPFFILCNRIGESHCRLGKTPGLGGIFSASYDHCAVGTATVFIGKGCLFLCSYNIFLVPNRSSRIGRLFLMASFAAEGASGA